MTKSTVRFFRRNLPLDDSGHLIPVYVVKMWTGIAWKILDAFECREDMDDFFPDLEEEI